MVWRLFLSNGHILGRVRISTVRVTSGSPGSYSDSETNEAFVEPTDGASPAVRMRLFPLVHDDGTNPLVNVEELHPGVFIYRPSEGFNYPKCQSTLRPGELGRRWLSRDPILGSPVLTKADGVELIDVFALYAK
ncbi:hypothetical protein K4F52_009400 [Lecanicillium sp. MT-2017a]|nr:hypothetical protein K4F52_009400 [Lecanicillium sp. MT-2017a]